MDHGPTIPSVWRVEHVAETGSTNADLLVRAKAGEAAGAVLVADHQTAGRGRLGRTWDAPPGSALLVSILFRPGGDPARWHRLTQAVSVAAVAACHTVAGVAPQLKWPNDLLVEERKLAGVLAEASADGAVVVGMGLNVSACPPGAAALAHEAGRPIDRDELLGALLDRLVATDLDRLVDAYRACLGTLGRQVRVELADGVVEGEAVSVADDGRLTVVDDAGRAHVVTYGDVIHLWSV